MSPNSVEIGPLPLVGGMLRATSGTEGAMFEWSGIAGDHATIYRALSRGGADRPGFGAVQQALALAHRLLAAGWAGACKPTEASLAAGAKAAPLTSAIWSLAFAAGREAAPAMAIRHAGHEIAFTPADASGVAVEIDGTPAPRITDDAFIAQAAQLSGIPLAQEPHELRLAALIAKARHLAGLAAPQIEHDEPGRDALIAGDAGHGLDDLDGDLDSRPTPSLMPDLFGAIEHVPHIERIGGRLSLGPDGHAGAPFDPLGPQDIELIAENGGHGDEPPLRRPPLADEGHADLFAPPPLAHAGTIRAAL